MKMKAREKVSTTSYVLPCQKHVQDPSHEHVQVPSQGFPQNKLLTSTPSLISSTSMLNLEPEYFDLVPIPEPPPFEKSFPSSLSTSLQNIVKTRPVHRTSVNSTIVTSYLYKYHIILTCDSYGFSSSIEGYHFWQAHRLALYLLSMGLFPVLNHHGTHKVTSIYLLDKETIKNMLKR
jgi:hypothetical protein